MPIFDTSITTLGLSEQRSNPLEDPGVSLASPAAWEWMTGGETSASGELVSEQNALSISTVYTCVTTLAEAVGSLPCKLIENLGNGRSEAINAPLYSVLATTPNPEMTAFTFWSTMVGCSALTGNGYAQIVRDGSGQVDSLWPLHPLKTEPVRLPDGTLVYKTEDGQTAGTYRIIASKDILHFPLFAWDGIKGCSPVKAAREALGLAKAAEKYGARWFGNGARPNGLLINKTSTKTDPKQRQEAIESWQRAHGGTNSNKQGFLWGDWTYQSIGLSPEDSQFLLTRAFQRCDIAAMFHISPHRVGDTTRLSNVNHQQEQLGFITDTLRPILCRIESELVRKLLPAGGRNSGRYYVEFDVSERLRGDTVATQTGYQLGRNGGWLCVNDIRKDMGLNPIGPEGDVYIVPVNYQNALRLLDAGSIQDESLGNDPSPTPAERNLLGAYARSYLALYKDAFGRLSHRNKRDYETLSTLFRPVLRSIADAAIIQNDAIPSPSDEPGDSADGFVNDVLHAMERRASKWSDNIDDLVIPEFNRAVRSLCISISKEIAATKAAASLIPEENDETAAA